MSEQRAHKIEEIRIPVPPSQVGIVAGILEGDSLAPAPQEYLVVERWSDYTIRHPTTGVQVSAELWHRDRRRALHLLRTEGR